MKKSLLTIVTLLLLMVCGLSHAQTNTGKLTADQVKEERAYATGIQALLWGWPLIEYVNTNYNAVKAGASKINYWRKFDALKTAADRYVVTPNNVSIDAYALLDLTTEPVVINVPSLQENRWYIVQIGDMFDEIVDNIAGIKGPQPGLYLLTGPDYNGPVPPNMKQIKIRTKFGVAATRIFVNGETDLPAARKVQTGFDMMPLSVFQNKGLKYAMPAAFSFPPFVAKGDATLSRFEELGNGMKSFLSINDDYSNPLVASFRQIGLSVSNGFDPADLDEATKRGLARAANVADQIIADAYQNSAVKVDGWRYTMADGRAGNDFAVRAALSRYVLGGNVPEQLIYPNNNIDADSQPLSGTKKYILHLDKDQIPPVSVLWNMSMYDDKFLFIENDFKRYSIGSTTDGLKKNADGSIDLYIQKDNPGKNKESNWLPAPAGPFNLTMRLYGAQIPVLNGSYHLPPVKKVN